MKKFTKFLIEKPYIFTVIFFVTLILSSCNRDRNDGRTDAYQAEPGPEMTMEAYNTERQELEQLDNYQTMERFPDDVFEYPSADLFVGGDPSLEGIHEEYPLPEEEFMMSDEGEPEVADQEEMTEDDEADDVIEMMENDGEYTSPH
jgi:hypothetical protein